MSLLFCSWATDAIEENNEEHSETEEEKTKKDIPSDDIIKVSEDSKEVKKAEINENILNVNGEHVIKRKEDAKPSMFILWKDSTLDYESENDEETELGNTTAEPTKEEEKEPPITTNGIKENGYVEHKEEDSPRKTEDTPPVKEPVFFAVWKDPNKEDEYISSSSEEVSDDNVDEVDEDSPVVQNDVMEEKRKTVEDSQSNLFDSLMGENGNDDLFNSIAKSVSTQMTTIFCDDDDFDIKRYDDSYNDNAAEDYNDAADGDIPSDSVSLDNGRRSRSASSHSVARSMQSSSSERGLRPKQERNYDFFSKPKKISKYFQPGTFIDKTLYKTHRCDVQIKKFKLQIQDLEELVPNRRKRKVIEAEEDLPLSKRRKMKKAEAKKEPKPRSLNSITKREEHTEVERSYSGFCKFVKAQCPLCWNFWRVSQPYGQHVINQTCQKTDISVPAGHVEMTGGVAKSAKFLRVHPATTRTDSYLSPSRVPSLKLLSRGSLPGGNSTSYAGVMSVKEGLEYYHSLIQPGSTDETSLFRYISGMAKITLVSNMKHYERLCRDPLKVAIYLEKKISRCRARLNSRHLLTRNWVEKYEFFLKLPLHDIFLSLSVPGFRVLEVPENDSVRQICLVCSSLQCWGCCAEEKSQSQQNNKTKGAARPPRKKIKSKAKNKKKARKDPQPRGSKSSGIKLNLHLCKKCKKYFKTVAALKSHIKYCR